MKEFIAALLLAFTARAGFSQGQVNFITKVGDVLDAPVTIEQTGRGPGSEAFWRAQLWLVGGDGSLSALLPVATFRIERNAEYYINAQDVNVPIEPGTIVTMRMRVFRGESWETSQYRGESVDFKQLVGGGLIPPPNLENLHGFTVNGEAIGQPMLFSGETTFTTLGGGGLSAVPEPTTLTLCLLAGLPFFLLKIARQPKEPGENRIL